MYILGISAFFHDSSAVLLKDGQIIAGADEERFTRIKHDTSFPRLAIDYCLKEANITPKQVKAIAFYEKPIRKFERVISSHVNTFPKSFWIFFLSMPSWIKEKLQVGRLLSKDKLNAPTFFIPHHLAHAASAFLASPFKESAILTMDGVGEWTTTAYGIGKNCHIKLTNEIKFPHSIGLLYSTVTAHLGFSVNNSEYKVMGLSAYGNKEKQSNLYYQKMKNLIDIKNDGSFALDMDYFAYHYKNSMPSEKFVKTFGPIRKKGEIVGKRHKDIAAAVQMITEDVYFKILNHIYRKTKIKNISIAGGVSLNSVANGKILSKTPFSDCFIQPHAGDGGTSLGACLYAYYSILNNNKKRIATKNYVYLGPQYSHCDIANFLKSNHIVYREYTSVKKLVNRVARLILENNVVGWFQGRMEWGPRALGARSILANPLNPKMKLILNRKVKHREEFRPFAPVVCRNDAHKYFQVDWPIPKPTDFMLMVYPVKKKFRKLLPSITHVDGSGRLQTISRQQHPLYYDLIKEFAKLSGIPILINTSFNIRGEPIVATPYDAYKCMMGTGIDYLVLGNFLIKRADNSQHMWDSELK